MSLTAFTGHWPTSSLVPGWALCALKTTGQPAARAEAVSPPAVEKAKREVAGAEHGHRAERDLALADVGAGQECGPAGPDRSGRRALPDHVGEEPQLAGGAPLALQAGCRQPGFLAGADGQFVADGLDVVRDRVEERRRGYRGPAC